MHLFLSPHLDDAVLSCGGLIDQLVRRGEKVVVRTIMAADPPQPMPDTPVLRDLHSRWEADEHPYIMRRKEDRAAVESLGAIAEYMNVRDCPYRTNAQGQPIYTLNRDLFGPIHPDDPALQTQLEISDEVQAIYAPLSAGGHVDHVTVRMLAQRLPQKVAIFYYEEYPYSASGGEAVRVTNDPQVQLFGSKAIQSALSAFDRPLEARVIPLAEENLVAKIAAIACYASQISTFWDSLADMDEKVRRYAHEVTPPAAERLWV